MAIPEEQIGPLKQQIIGHINSTFPEDRKNDAIQQIESMDEQQLEEFLIQNNLISGDSGEQKQQCVFCSIARGQAPSVKLDENQSAIAILEINPLSEGHTIIVPKGHLEKNPPEAENLARHVERKIKSALNPKDIIAEHENLFGHSIINIIPVYGDELKKERKKASQEELAKLQEKIKKSSEKKFEHKQLDVQNPERNPEIIKEKDSWLPRRIP